MLTQHSETLGVSKKTGVAQQKSTLSDLVFMKITQIMSNVNVQETADSLSYKLLSVMEYNDYQL
jgi:hypothetical protein